MKKKETNAVQATEAGGNKELRILSIEATKKEETVRRLRGLVTDSKGETMLGLGKARGIVEGKQSLKNVSAEKAEAIVAELKKLGAEVRLVSKEEAEKNNGRKAIGKNSVQAGEIITFGSYAGEPIEWRVLEAREDGTYLLLSEYGLEVKAYNNDDESVTWETCDLREWLNGEFYETAFTEEERGKIQLTQVTNADNPTDGTEGGKDTQDNVYLLSLEEVQKYFKLEDDEEDCVLGKSSDLICMPTEHAVDSGAYTLSSEDVKFYQPKYSYELREGACWWWLRSPGSYSDCAAYVNCLGYVVSIGFYVYSTIRCVRPVVVVRLS